MQHISILLACNYILITGSTSKIDALFDVVLISRRDIKVLNR